MFEFVRQHTKWMMGLMFLLIIPSFVFWGVSGYERMREKGDAVARVGSQDITQAQWDAAHRNQVERIRAQMPSVDVKLLDTPQARYDTLERLVQEMVLNDAADKAHLVVSDDYIVNYMRTDPALASLRKPDGSVDKDAFALIARSQGLTPDGLIARLKQQIATARVQGGLAQTTFASAALANVTLNAFFDRREVQVARFNTNDYVGKVNPSDADIEAYYKANQAQFQAAEQADIDYVVLDLAAVKKTITLNEADVKTYYEQNVAKLSGPEERRASHILINAPKDAPAADRAKAKARAQELLAQVRKAPDSFAEVAKKNSQDAGSAVNGGDLGFNARGAMVSEFDAATFALKPGEISDVVETQYGYHIIKLAEVKAPKQRSFEEMRAEIENDLKTQQAQKKFAEAAEAFTNGVYEQADSLKPVADKLKLELKTAAKLQRTPLPGATGELANAKFLAAIFSPDSIEKKHNTEAVEIAPNTLAAAHVNRYAPARVQPLAEVMPVVKARLVAVRAADMAKKEGMDKLAAWKAKPDSATLEPAVVVSRDQPEKLPQEVVNAALHANAASLPAFTGVDLGTQGYVVVRLNKLVPRAPVDEANAKRERASYERAWASAEGEAYYTLLKDRFKVQIKAAQPPKLAAAGAGAVTAQ